MLELHPGLVKTKEAVSGYTGDFESIKDKIFEGVDQIDKNGVLGDPTLARKECGRGYLDDVIDYIADNLR